MIHLAGHVDRRTVRQVPAVSQVEAHEGVARLQAGEEHGHVRLRTGMRLDIGIFGVEKFAEAVDGQLLDLVDHFATSIIAGARITFCIFVGAHAAECLKHLLAHKVFGRDELKAFTLAFLFFADQVGNLDVLFHMDRTVYFTQFALIANRFTKIKQFPIFVVETLTKTCSGN